MLVSLLLMMFVQNQSGTLVVNVRAGDKPASSAQVIVDGQTYVTDAAGRLRLPGPAGTVEVTALANGFLPATAVVTVVAGEERSITLELVEQPTNNASRCAPTATRSWPR